MDDFNKVSAQPLRVRAYLSQYVSLVLIILTFVVGSLINHGAKGLKAPPKVETAAAAAVEIQPPDLGEPAAAQPQWLAGAVSAAELYSPQSKRLQPERAAALIEVLRSHDLNLAISLSAANFTLEDAGALYRAFYAAGAPPGSAWVSLKPGLGEPLKLQFSKLKRSSD